MQCALVACAAARISGASVAASVGEFFRCGSRQGVAEYFRRSRRDRRLLGLGQGLADSDWTLAALGGGAGI
jgi:hypothetical protein